MKLSDFARVYGISERHARRLLVENEADMLGHYERQGNKGTVIDNIGVDILKSKLQKSYDVKIESASERERQLEGTITELSMRYAAAMEKLAENAGAVALLEAAKENVSRLEADRKEAQEQRLEAEKRAQEAEETAGAAEAEAERVRAENEELKALLEQIATSKGFKRRKLLKELKKRGGRHG